MLPHRTLVLAGERIQGIGTPDKPVEIPAGARTIEGAGKFVIPGLIDAHVHLVHLADRTHVTGDEFLPLFLAAGVTSVRSAGDAIVAETGVQHFAEAHPERCPRVFWLARSSTARRRFIATSATSHGCAGGAGDS